MHRTWHRAVLLVGLALAGPVCASDSLQTIVDQQRELQADLDDARLPGLTSRQTGTIRKAQAQLFALTEGKTELDDLSPDDRVRLANALERINAVLVGTRAAENGAQECRREQLTGSRFIGTVCATGDERDEARERARAAMAKPQICDGGRGC